MKKRLAPKRKGKFNEDWKRDFAWISKLPDCGLAQYNLCATDFSISSGGRTDVRRHQESVAYATLGWDLPRVGWSSMSPTDKMK